MFNNTGDKNITKLIKALEENTRVHRKLLVQKNEERPKVLYTDNFANQLGIKPASLRCYVWQAKKGNEATQKYLPRGFKGNRPYWVKSQLYDILGYDSTDSSIMSRSSSARSVAKV